MVDDAALWLPSSPLPDKQLNKLDWDEDRDCRRQERHNPEPNYEPRPLVTHMLTLANHGMFAIGSLPAIAPQIDMKGW